MAPCSGIKFKYKMGPIPAGMSTMVELEMAATGGVLREDGLYDLVHTLVMTNQNRETTQLPILGLDFIYFQGIKTESKFLRWQKWFLFHK